MLTAELEYSSDNPFLATDQDPQDPTKKKYSSDNPFAGTTASGSYSSDNPFAPALPPPTAPVLRPELRGQPIDLVEEARAREDLRPAPVARVDERPWGQPVDSRPANRLRTVLEAPPEEVPAGQPLARPTAKPIPLRTADGEILIGPNAAQQARTQKAGPPVVAQTPPPMPESVAPEERNRRAFEATGVGPGMTHGAVASSVKGSLEEALVKKLSSRLRDEIPPDYDVIERTGRAAASMARHPLETLYSLGGMVVEPAAILGAFTRQESERAGLLGPGPRASERIVPPRDAAFAAGQLLALGVTPALSGALEAVFGARMAQDVTAAIRAGKSPQQALLLGYAAHVASRAAITGGVGAVYSPDDPAVGFLLGATIGGIHAAVNGLPWVLVPNLSIGAEVRAQPRLEATTGEPDFTVEDVAKPVELKVPEVAAAKATEVSPPAVEGGKPVGVPPSGVEVAAVTPKAPELPAMPPSVPQEAGTTPAPAEVPPETPPAVVPPAPTKPELKVIKPELPRKPVKIQASLTARDEYGTLRTNLRAVPTDALERESGALTEANRAEEALHDSIVESGYRGTYEELPRTERLGRKRQEDLPDAEGEIDPEKLAAHNKALREYNSRTVVRAARQRSIDRIETELRLRREEAEQADADQERRTERSGIRGQGKMTGTAEEEVAPGVFFAPNLFGEEAPTPKKPAQSGLFGADEGTETAREKARGGKLAPTEAAARREIDALKAKLVRTLSPAKQRPIKERIALLEKLVNRGKAITAGELSTRAGAERDPILDALVPAPGEAGAPEYTPNAEEAAITKQFTDNAAGYTDQELERLRMRLTDQSMRAPRGSDTQDTLLLHMGIVENEIARRAASVPGQERLPATTADEDLEGPEPQGTLLAPADKSKGELQTDSPAFRNWFGDSQVVDDEGEPRVLYHGTSVTLRESAKPPYARQDLAAFRISPNDVGIHVGTQGQANDRLAYLEEARGEFQQGARILPVYVRLLHPLRVPDVGAFNLENLNAELEEQGIFTVAELDRIGNHDGEGARNGALRRALIDKGYDGLVYKNTGETAGGMEYRKQLDSARKAFVSDYRKRTGEDWRGSVSPTQATWPTYQAYDRSRMEYEQFRERGAEDSYVVFEPTQIKSAIGNRGTFDSNDINITHAPATGPTVEDLKATTQAPATARAQRGDIKSLKEIVDNLSRMAGVPIRQGRFGAKRRNALGVFIAPADVARVVRFDKLDTAAHEVGHYVSRKYLRNPTQKNASARGAPRLSTAMKRELVKMGKDLYGSRKPAGGYGEEGIAQWAKFYVIDPAQLTKDAPLFEKWAEREVLAKEPGLKAALDASREDYKAYRAAPATARIDAMINMKPESRLVPSARKLATWFLDDLAEIRRAVEELEAAGKKPVDPARNAYTLARLTRGAAGRADDMVTKGVIDKDGLRVTRGFGEILKGLRPIELQELRRYLVAERTIEVNARGVNTGIERADAIEGVRLYAKKYGDIAKEIWSISQALIDYRVDHGNLTADEGALLKKNNAKRVGFYRVFDEDEVASPPKGSGKGFGRNSSGLRKMRGSARQILDPLESVITDYYKTVKQSLSSEVMATLVKQARRTEGGGAIVEELIEAPQQLVKINVAKVMSQLRALGLRPEGEAEGELSSQEITGMIYALEDKQQAGAAETKDLVRPVVVDGKRVWVELKDAQLYDALSGLGTPELQAWLRWLSVPTRTVRAGATLTLEFLTRNPARDAVTAAIYSRAGTRPPGFDFVRGLFHVLADDATCDRWRQSGGDNAAMLGLDRPLLRKRLADLTRGPVGQRAGWVLKPIDTLRLLSSLFENATRVGEFAGVERKALKAGATPKQAQVEAGIAARDVTIDFAQAGQYTRIFNQLIAFLNANVRGWAKLSRELKERPHVVLPRILAWITLPSLALWWLQKDDEDYQNVPAWQKALAWVIVQRDGTGKLRHIWRIPKPPDLGILFGSVPESIAQRLYEQDPRALAKFGDAISTLNPLHLPDAIKPLVEWWANKDTFTDRKIVPEGLEDLPPGEQSTSRTGEAARAVGKATGTSPAQLEHVVRGYGAGLAQYGLEAANQALRAARAGLGLKPLPAPAVRQNEQLESAPLLRGFMVRHPGLDAQPITDALALFDHAEAQRKAWNRYRTAGDKTNADQYFAAHRQAIESVATPEDGLKLEDKVGPLRLAHGLILDATRLSRDAADSTRERVASTAIAAARAALAGHVTRDAVRDDSKAFKRELGNTAKDAYRRMRPDTTP